LAESALVVWIQYLILRRDYQILIVGKLHHRISLYA
jgi:hypothetical protein